MVLNANNFTSYQKQKIASYAGYSETVFVSSKNNCNSDVDYYATFFTPTEEVSFCGHATLAFFHILFQQEEIGAGRYKFSAKAGLFSVIVAENGLITMSQLLPETLTAFSAEEVAPLLNLTVETLLSTSLPFEVLSTGLSDLIIPIPLGKLNTITPNFTLIKEFCIKKSIIGLHLFELNETGNAVTANCRNFAPAVGIKEESATGSACGALACYLNKHLNLGNFTFEQGSAMHCCSLIYAQVNVQNSQISSIKVGGFSQLIKMEKLAYKDMNRVN